MAEGMLLRVELSASYWIMREVSLCLSSNPLNQFSQIFIDMVPDLEVCSTWWDSRCYHIDERLVGMYLMIALCTQKYFVVVVIQKLKLWVLESIFYNRLFFISSLELVFRCWSFYQWHIFSDHFVWVRNASLDAGIAI